jgi:hypothetical protein
VEEMRKSYAFLIEKSEGCRMFTRRMPKRGEDEMNLKIRA